MTAAERCKMRNQINRKLGALANSRITLGDWLKQASDLHPDIAAALEGIWCGREGSVTAELPSEWKAFLVMGWCYGKVEYAYIS